MAVHLHIDPFSGIAGDMFLAALIDLGLDRAALEKALSPLGVDEQFELRVQHVMRRGIRAVGLDVVTHDHPHHHGHGHGEHAHHHHRHYGDLVAMVQRLDASPRARERARRIIDALAQAEAHVHGIAIEKVHFHEVGAIDSIVDMFGAAVGLELFDVASMSCGPLPLSRGFVRCEHGRMPVPAPATAHLMKGLPTVGVDRDGELVTPTGAAIVRALCDDFAPPPKMIMQGIGYGAGQRDDPHWPNVLRLFLGRRAEQVVGG